MTDNNELIHRFKQGDARAGDELVERNMGLVYSIAGKMANGRYETEDIVQIGAMGLVKAVNRFDDAYGVRFSTYAVPMIIGEIKRFFRDDGAIKVSRSLKEVYIRGRRAEERLRERLGRNPTMAEIAKEVGCDESVLLESYEASVMPESLQSTVGGESGGLRLEDVIAQHDTEEKIVDKVFVKEALAVLNERERGIIIMRYFRGKTQSEIAAQIGVSQVQVSRIEKKAIEKIRKEIAVDQ